MKAYQESKEIGNLQLPIRIYNISINEHNTAVVESLSGTGPEVEKEYCMCPSYVPHYHSYLEIIQILEGSAQMQINNEYIHLEAEDIILVGANEIHWLSGVCKHIVLHINPLSLIQVQRNFDELFPCSLEYRWLKKHGNFSFLHKVISTNLQRFISLYSSRPKGFVLFMMSYLYELLGNIESHSASTAEACSSKTTYKKDDLKRLHIVLDFINENYDQEIAIDDICALVNLTPNYFCRFFKKYMGKTFFEYLHHYRCSQAEVLFYSTDLSITEIAMRVGFSSISYFDKVYRKIKGYAPSVERRKQALG